MRPRSSTSAKAPYLFFLLPVLMLFCFIASPAAQPASGPAPLLKTGQPVDWWFVFKFGPCVYVLVRKGQNRRQLPIRTDCRPHGGVHCEPPVPSASSSTPSYTSTAAIPVNPPLP